MFWFLFIITSNNRSKAVETEEDNNMKATGIVRRIDDLGRVVIPKEIRRTLRIREGDPSQIILSEYERFGFAMIRLEERWLGRWIHRAKIIKLRQRFLYRKICLSLFLMENEKGWGYYLWDFILKPMVRTDILKEKMFINENSGTRKNKANVWW